MKNITKKQFLKENNLPIVNLTNNAYDLNNIGGIAHDINFKTNTK